MRLDPRRVHRVGDLASGRHVVELPLFVQCRTRCLRLQRRRRVRLLFQLVRFVVAGIQPRQVVFERTALKAVFPSFICVCRVVLFCDTTVLYFSVAVAMSVNSFTSPVALYWFVSWSIRLRATCSCRSIPAAVRGSTSVENVFACSGDGVNGCAARKASREAASSGPIGATVGVAAPACAVTTAPGCAPGVMGLAIASARPASIWATSAAEAAAAAGGRVGTTPLVGAPGAPGPPAVWAPPASRGGSEGIVAPRAGGVACPGAGVGVAPYPRYWPATPARAAALASAFFGLSNPLVQIAAASCGVFACFSAAPTSAWVPCRDHLPGGELILLPLLVGLGP